MKTMKKLILLISIMSFLTLTTFSQISKTFVIKNGIDEKIPIEFKIYQSSIDEIKISNIFKYWNDTIYNDKDINDLQIQLNKWDAKKIIPKLNEVDQLLFTHIELASELIVKQLKNKESYIPLRGDIMYHKISKDDVTYDKDMDKDKVEELTYTIYYKAQNGYGNMLMSKSYITMTLNTNGSSYWKIY